MRVVILPFQGCFWDCCRRIIMKHLTACPQRNPRLHTEPAIELVLTSVAYLINPWLVGSSPPSRIRTSEGTKRHKALPPPKPVQIPSDFSWKTTSSASHKAIAISAINQLSRWSTFTRQDGKPIFALIFRSVPVRCDTHGHGGPIRIIDSKNSTSTDANMLSIGSRGRSPQPHPPGRGP